jgi:hypothetical protein
MYSNYEVMSNLFAGTVIDLSKVKIYQVESSKLSKKDLENFLMEQNLYSKDKFYARFEESKKLKEVEKELREKERLKSEEAAIIDEALNKKYERPQKQDESLKSNKKKQGKMEDTATSK